MIIKPGVSAAQAAIIARVSAITADDVNGITGANDLSTTYPAVTKKDVTADMIAAFAGTSGTILSSTNKVIDAAVAGTSGTAVSRSNKLVDKADPAMTNARTPTAHAATHTNGTDNIQSATHDQNGLATAAQITEIERLTALLALEIGLIKECGYDTVPDGYLECDGSAVSRTTYAALFAKIGTKHGVGDGSTTFNLPERRGEFPRGWDHGRGIDSGRAFASAQEAGTKFPFTIIGTGGTGAWAGSNPAFKTGAGDSETRPRNIAVMYIIKY